LFRGTNQRRKAQEGEKQKSSRKGVLEFLVKASECEICSQRETNDSRPLDLVKLQEGEPRSISILQRLGKLKT
jgi:hypothetical protein